MSFLSRTKMFQRSFLEPNSKIVNKHLVTLFLWALSLQMKEKIPSFSSLNDASFEEVIVASNPYICAHILNAAVLGEMSAIYISICNKL